MFPDRCWTIYSFNEIFFLLHLPPLIVWGIQKRGVYGSILSSNICYELISAHILCCETHVYDYIEHVNTALNCSLLFIGLFERGAKRREGEWERERGSEILLRNNCVNSSMNFRGVAIEKFIHSFLIWLRTSPQFRKFHSFILFILINKKILFHIKHMSRNDDHTSHRTIMI